MKVSFRTLFTLLTFALWVAACSATRQLPDASSLTDFRSRSLPASPQVGGGDPQQGHEYITTGGYIGSGIPWAFFNPESREPDTLYPRPGDNGLTRPSYNVFAFDNGVKVSSGNCFSCHAQTFQGSYQLGLGEVDNDYAENRTLQLKFLNALIKRRFGSDSPEWEAFSDYRRFLNSTAPYIITPFDGPNPAFRLEEGCVLRRDPVTLEYQEEPGWEMIDYTLATDVPPLWHLKKKTAIYWNGMGRGDFSKLLMQASVLGIHDSTAAREVQKNFVDVVAWGKTLEPPAYPREIDQDLALKGKVVFEERCSRCHGTYGDDWTYPNKLVSLVKVGTDPYMALYFTRQSGLPDWYNQSWYATSAPYSQLVAEEGYVAPPLDGIWATAPYLHNGSVPTLEALLNSTLRPEKWARRPDAYDFEAVGWKYDESGGKKRSIYNTTLPGYGNEGHYFGDRLQDPERDAVIEYLKTL
ncbi:MAG TPA: hypothetical protein DCE41_07575 [Cytophagales bacterium]|nr:hypothetical protein [Cytophagales bacterium]HAA18120.1 hypothetical protein [Cytophagales bacterium]HAP62092.1 hypothetical protein [Cytophagales bacterium]